jgi:transcriptional regulator with XRE-family HTH domain
MSIFGERLQQARQARGLSQSEIARRLGMPRQQINNYEKGRFDPGLDIAGRIADVLEVSLDFLTGRSDEMESELEAANTALVGA